MNERKRTRVPSPYKGRLRFSFIFVWDKYQKNHRFYWASLQMLCLRPGLEGSKHNGLLLPSECIVCVGVCTCAHAHALPFVRSRHMHLNWKMEISYLIGLCIRVWAKSINSGNNKAFGVCQRLGLGQLWALAKQCTYGSRVWCWT